MHRTKSVLSSAKVADQNGEKKQQVIQVRALSTVENEEANTEWNAEKSIK